MSARQSAPSAMATARCVSTTPGSWVCQLIPHSAMASDIASVKPAAIGQFGQEGGTGMRHEVLAVGYHFGATDRATTVHLQGALRVWSECVFGDKHSPRCGGLLRGRRAPCSEVARIIEVRASRAEPGKGFPSQSTASGSPAKQSMKLRCGADEQAVVKAGDMPRAAPLSSRHSRRATGGARACCRYRLVDAPLGHLIPGASIKETASGCL